MDMSKRERKVDVNNMSADEVDVLSVQIGDRIKAICDEAAAKANAILNIYGANCKIAIAFDQLPQKMANSLKSKGKEGVKPSKA
jgi:hypothetical protein